MKLDELHKRKQALQNDLIECQMAISELSQANPPLYTCPTCGAKYEHSQGFTHWLNECVREVIG